MVGGWALGLASLFACVACGGSGAGASGAQPETSGEVTANAAPSEIARIHKSRCGSCHVRVEPGERTREQLKAAFLRHRRRVHLTPEQWQAMIDYLAVK